MRLIDGDTVKENLQQMLMDELGDTDFVDGVRQGIEMAIDVIDEHLTVDIERHGHWIPARLCSTNGGTYGIRRCSNCEYCYNDFGDEWNYCPNCGAKMDEEVEE